MEKTELQDICVHGIDRWNEGCEMCNALNSLSMKNIVLQKFDREDFFLTEQQMRKKYGIGENE